MNNHKAKSTRKISFMLLLIFGIGIGWLFLCGFLIWNSFQIRTIYSQAEKSHQHYFEYTEAALLLRSGSDYLTDQSRLFVATFNLDYLNNYFHEVKSSRRREQALEIVSSMKDANDSALSHLQAALVASRHLMLTEFHSMKLIATACNFPDTILPPEVLNYHLPNAELALTPSEQQKLAYSILFDSAYLYKKNSIMSSVSLFMNKNIQSSQIHFRELTNELIKRIRTQIIIICICIILLLILFFVTFQQNKKRIKLQELQLKQEQELASEKAKSFFFASISHDIRTPLNAILGFAELLQSDDVDQQTRKQYLRSIQVSGQNLMQLINDILDLSKLEADKMQFNPEPTDLEKLLEDIRSVFIQQAQAKHIDLIIDYKQIPPVDIDQQRISQILINLVGNAMKFTKEGSITLRAFFSETSESEGTLSLAVCDTGCGISNDDIHKLTKPYVQLQTSQRIKGTGLGLAICNLLLRKMNGRLDIFSVLGKGSRFTAIIDKVHFGANAIPTNTVSTSSDNVQAKVSDNCSLLLVDDSTVNLTVLKAMCNRLGLYQIDLAPNGKEALEKLHQKTYDCVLTDLWMPVMDGQEFISVVRKEEKIKSTRVIVITADVEVQKNYKEMGFDEILLKPITLQSLNTILSSLTP
ncbi:MAG: response regulator [Victivallales bacterium]|nr:response regulator [Victivallales bacterium]